jgi:uncharacterized Tic20 family protein
MEVYKLDLEGKINLIINNRIKQKFKNKRVLKNWKHQINDAGKEFNYIYSWKFFGILGLIFIVEFIYSTVISYNYSKFLFGVHLFIFIYFVFLILILDNNFKLIARKKKNGRKRKN